MSQPQMRKVSSHGEAEAILATCELHAMLGLTLARWEQGYVVFSFVPPAFARDRESRGVHGGAIATALDTVAGFAVTSSSGFDIYTIDLRVDFLRPAVDELFNVEGTALRVGKRFGWGEAILRSSDSREVAAARGTFGW